MIKQLNNDMPTEVWQFLLLVSAQSLISNQDIFISLNYMHNWLYHYIEIELVANFLNQAHAGLWPMRAWFLKIDPVQIVIMCVFVCMCVSTPEAINT